jgi:hypothetical protein
MPWFMILMLGIVGWFALSTVLGLFIGRGIRAGASTGHERGFQVLGSVRSSTSSS